MLGLSAATHVVRPEDRKERTHPRNFFWIVFDRVA
jgi:hypothetical protein